MLVEGGGVDPGILGVGMEDPIAKLSEHRCVVHELKDKVRRVKLSPKLGLGMSANIRRQIAGEVARFLPPGHSSLPKLIGQFSMPIFTPLLSARPISGRQVSRNLGQLASIGRAGSRPMKELTRLIPSAAEVSMTSLKWATAVSDSLRSGGEGSDKPSAEIATHAGRQVVNFGEGIGRSVGRVDMGNPRMRARPSRGAST